MAEKARRERLLEFLTERKATPVCERCTKNEWLIPTEDSMTLRLSIMDVKNPNSVAIPGPSVPVDMMVCKNCGNVRLTASAIVDPETFGPAHD